MADQSVSVRSTRNTYFQEHSSSESCSGASLPFGRSAARTRSELVVRGSEVVVDFGAEKVGIFIFISAIFLAVVPDDKFFNSVTSAFFRKTDRRQTSAVGDAVDRFQPRIELRPQIHCGSTTSALSPLSRQTQVSLQCHTERNEKWLLI